MINDDLLLPGFLGLVVLILVVLLVVTVRALRRERARVDADLQASHDEAARLRERVEALARQMEVRPSREEFVITGIGRDDDAPATDPSREPQRIEGKLFVDLVMRESVVRAASLTHGVRRALAPATRNRIRFAMKQEIKRSRKERRIEFREVRREMAARRSAEAQPSTGRAGDGSQAPDAAEDVA